MALPDDPRGGLEEHRRPGEQEHPLAGGLERQPVDLSHATLVDAQTRHLEHGPHEDATLAESRCPARDTMRGTVVAS